MVARLRRSKRVGVASIVIAVALLGSAWLAYASGSPHGGTYPVTAVKAKGQGDVCIPPMFSHNRPVYTRAYHEGDSKHDNDNNNNQGNDDHRFKPKPPKPVCTHFEFE